MYSSSYYKHGAGARLKGRYLPLLLGAVITMLPSYIIAQISVVLEYVIPDAAVIGMLVAVVTQILVINIFEIGFMRLLLGAERVEPGNFKSRDFNVLLSGYTQNFGNTLKATFMRQIKIFGWMLVAAVPIIAVLVFIAATMSSGSALYVYSLAAKIMTEPTPEAIMEFSNFLDMTYPHIGVISAVYTVLTVIAFVPVIRKTYEYQMIPMIIADDPDMPCRAAFKRTRDIMTGFRFRYFLLQLSFIMYYVIIGSVILATNSPLAVCAAVAALMPYQYMTYLEFYRQRNNIIEHNISTYGEQEMG